MPLIIIFLVWYFVIGRNKPEIFDKIKNRFGKIILAVILLSVFSSVIPTLLMLLCLFSPVIVLVLLFVLFRNKKKDKKYRDDTKEEREQLHVAGKGLVKAVPKRRRIVEKFNKSFDLALTDDQIKTIVNASYVSVLWESEILAMDKTYNSIYEWFHSDTAWLRTYLYVFKVQEVSSDFAEQRRIAFDAFNQIFSEMNFREYVTRKDALWDMNNRYFTCFDDVTFMIAYRFLQSEGKDYDIGSGQILRNEDETDILARKYS